MSGFVGPIRVMGKVVTKINVNGVPTPIKVTPIQLDNDWSKNRNQNRKTVDGKTERSNKRRRNTIFRNNGYRLMERLVKAYNVSYTLTEVRKDNVWHEVRVEIPHLNINVFASGSTKRAVKRRITYAIHRSYCNQLY